jgi:solute carrier family 36 (proton-coupled amino acid transporter)
MYPTVKKSNSFFGENPLLGELIFRTCMVLVTFAVAILVPQLDLLLSLIGAVCSTMLALVLPPILEFIIMPCESNFTRWWIIIKNNFILLLALLGFLTGGYESLTAIVKTFFEN